LVVKKGSNSVRSFRVMPQPVSVTAMVTSRRAQPLIGPQRLSAVAIDNLHVRHRVARVDAG